MTPDTQHLTPDTRALWDAAVRVLRSNDVGGWTKPAPRLYPHQWSWDSAFVAIGLAHVDPDRALLELESLFVAQWADGRVPHIVYNPAAPPNEYFPDAQRWACADLSPHAPKAPASSGLVQPPIHALAVWWIVSVVPEPERLLPRLRALYPKLLAWHRYLAGARDPEGSGLLTIYHPWESGTDNSPRWDAPLANVAVGAVPAFTRRDLQHVADSSHRPTDAEYDRYLWLIESLKQARYDDAEIYRSHPFLVKDVLSSAIFALASDALGRLSDWLNEQAAREDGRADTPRPTYAMLLGGVVQAEPRADQREIAGWSIGSSAALRERLLAGSLVLDGSLRPRGDEAGSVGGLALDIDLRTGRSIPVRTCAGFAPLLAPRLETEIGDRSFVRPLTQLVGDMFGPEFAGASGLAYPVVPSTAPGSAGFHPRTYWRGPTWPFANWLFCLGLRQHGFAERAAQLRAAFLALLARPEARFAEYFEPFTAEPLGSLDQSWSAAMALDWLASG